jgi:putative nucleotidyltransferase with HDIG domain
MSQENHYISISLNRIIPEQNLPGDLFLFVGGHFIKYKHKGDLFSADKFNEFLLKKIDFVFCADVDIKQFDSWYETLREKSKQDMVEQVGKDAKPLVETREEIKDELFKIFASDVTDSVCQEMQEKTRKFISLVASRKTSQASLKTLMNYNPTIGEHSVNVATLSIYLCFHLGYTHQLILENVYMGALLHDIGKTKLDMKMLESANPKQYEEMMRNHADLGKNILLQSTTLPQEVIKIVAEHHENHDGTGYPRKIKGSRIYELAKIVSIANEFDNYAMSFKGDLKEKQNYAIAELEKDKAKRFDPKKLQKCLEVLKRGL